MISILLLGVLIGMQHAMEADHVAAVASIAADQNLFRRAVAHGAVWGFGHTLTLMAVTGTAIIVDASLDAALTEWFEGAVGVMLIGLGLQVFYRFGMSGCTSIYTVTMTASPIFMPTPTRENLVSTMRRCTSMITPGACQSARC